MVDGDPVRLGDPGHGAGLPRRSAASERGKSVADWGDVEDAVGAQQGVTLPTRHAVDASRCHAVAVTP